MSAIPAVGDCNLDPPEDPRDLDTWTDAEVAGWIDTLAAAGFDVEPYRWSGVNDCVSVAVMPQYLPDWVRESARVVEEGWWTRCYWPGAGWPKKNRPCRPPNRREAGESYNHSSTEARHEPPGSK